MLGKKRKSSAVGHSIGLQESATVEVPTRTDKTLFGQIFNTGVTVGGSTPPRDEMQFLGTLGTSSALNQVPMPHKNFYSLHEPRYVGLLQPRRCKLAPSQLIVSFRF